MIPDWVILSRTQTLHIVALVAAVALFAYISFQPCVKAIIRRPLQKYVRMEFGDFEMSLLHLSFVFTDVQLIPQQTPIISGIFAALFPSAIVRSYEESKEYPGSKISIKRLKVGLRVGTFARTHDEHAGVLKTLFCWVRQYLFQRPIISVELNNVTLEVEKAYIAPQPPPEFHTINSQVLPSAIPSAKLGPEIPAFDQDYVLHSLRDGEISYANAVTFWMERWIKHTVKNKEKDEANAYAAKDRTDDEKMNARIETLSRAILHSISIQLTDASIVISGAGSQHVKATRKQHDPRDSNLILANTPKTHRALTIFGADLISISFSPDDQCDLILCLNRVYVKVGDPLPAVTNQKNVFSNILTAEIMYAWHTIVHPFDVVTELKGIIPYIIWNVNYDHDWKTRTLGLNLSSTEVAISMSPNHLQTALLHLD
eukprot:CAMPEP_0183745000 /NCGR_PEP_ID=MMETSP0737-20130205/66017_1 /TAXON_ID=385413 /ORGANISM="Thalassiosira miniscula, Strain CCMP1093" /LENGTH=427 /DNA_ID=CAMNT_0025980655 /DNA_START=235 /DNA_END=1515 /DNA_ORIENTATION=+